MRSSLVLLLSLALVALSSAFGGSHEFRFNFGSPGYGEESKEAEESQVDNRHPSFYTKDVIHGMGPQHSFLTIDFPKHNFPEPPYKPDFPQHFESASRHGKEAPRSSAYRKEEDYAPKYESASYDAPRYEAQQDYRKPYSAKEGPGAEVSVVKTRDGKKIMTMTKPGYKMVVEEMEGKPGDKTKMVGRTVKETKSTKDEGDNGETMHQSQSYQYQVVQSESTDDKQQPQTTYVRNDGDAKGIDFSRFAQPQKEFKNNFPSEFPGQYGYQQHQQRQQPQNPFGFQVPKAFEGLRIPPGIGRHIGF